MVSMLAGMFRSFHVHIDLGRKEFLWRSVLEYVNFIFKGWCARVAAYGVSWGIHRAGTSNRPLIILNGYSFRNSYNSLSGQVNNT